jgi:hypothetical protein
VQLQQELVMERLGKMENELLNDILHYILVFFFSSPPFYMCFVTTLSAAKLYSLALSLTQYVLFGHNSMHITHLINH